MHFLSTNGWVKSSHVSLVGRLLSSCCLLYKLESDGELKSALGCTCSQPGSQPVSQSVREAEINNFTALPTNQPASQRMRGSGRQQSEMKEEEDDDNDAEESHGNPKWNLQAITLVRWMAGWMRHILCSAEFSAVINHKLLNWHRQRVDGLPGVVVVLERRQ